MITIQSRAAGVVYRIALGAALLLFVVLPASAAMADDRRDALEAALFDCWSGRYEASAAAAREARSGEVVLEADDCAVATTWSFGIATMVSFPLRAGFPLSGTAAKSAYLRLIYRDGAVAELNGKIRLDNQDTDSPWITFAFPEPVDVGSIERIYIGKTVPQFCANPVFVKSCAKFRDDTASPP